MAAYDITNKKMTFFDEKRRGDFLFISGTKMRGLARKGEKLPEGFMSEKAWSVLASYYRSLSDASA